MQLNVVKSVLIPLGLIAAASAADPEIYKRSSDQVIVILPLLHRVIPQHQQCQIMKWKIILKL